MSCVRWVEIAVRDCADSARQQREVCVQRSQTRVRVCAETAQQSREECAETREVETRECSDWGEERHQQCCTWQPCAFFCNALVWVVETVCVGWTTITSTVCAAYHTVVELVCVAYEWIVRGVCVAWATVVTGSCAAVGLVLEGACRLIGAFDVRIAESDYEPPAPSTVRLTATSMSIARVTSETAFADTGTRFFFRIVDGRVDVRTVSSGWQPVAPLNGNPLAISYHRRCRGERSAPPYFDMVAADSGRVLVKERGRASFYFTMLDPMFRRDGNQPVPSAYFKLNPEQGLDTANTADRVQHLLGDDSDHPAAVRFPLFRMAMQPNGDSMVVNIDRNMGVWHRIDARPPKDAPNAPALAGMPAPEAIVVYEQRGLPPFGRQRISRSGYRIHRVLDIGVGHEHWHEQRCRIYGGEMDSLDGPGLRFLLRGRDVYRMFNGPVDDQGGFIDGTINYYVLAQFVRDEQLRDDAVARPEAFGILWLDEQAVLSERWRLVTPDDSKFGAFRDIIPSAVVQYMDKDFAHFHFDRSKFWDPMRAGHVTSDSRMAVSRQTIVLSGRDPKSGEPELYSINFSFGTSDRTWRWRCFPPKTDLRSAFDLREDMTIFVHEGDTRNGRYWYQRYLPASGRMNPDGRDLLLADGAPRPNRTLDIDKPPRGFGHGWQWLPDDVFEFVHAHFSHFGCYEERVDWRWQYYRVDVPDNKALRDRDENTPWTEQGNTLSITKASLNWTLVNTLLQGDVDAIATIGADIWTRVTGAIARWVSGELTRDELADLLVALQNTPLVRHVHHRGLFHPHFVLKLRYRDPLGWILVHWDKRDDDLLPFRDFTTESGTAFELQLQPGLPPAARPLVPMQVRTYHQVLDPPAIDEARVILLTQAARIVRIRVELRPAQTAASIDENVWRIKLGALQRDVSDALAAAERLLDEIRVRAPVQDVPQADWLGYEWDVGGWPAERLDRLRECCSESGRQRFGTSLWFENVVGHVATPDCLEFGVREMPNS